MRSSPPKRTLSIPWGPVLLVSVATLVCYWPALTGSFLWDDSAYVPRLGLRSGKGLWLIWSDVRATQQYYPVLFSAFWIEHRLWGDHALGYHLVNVLFHASSACVFALILRRLWAAPSNGRAGPKPVQTPPPGAEWLAALLFAVHPVCVESVAWITEQKNTLSLLFYLLAALAYLEFAAHRRLRWYVAASVLFVLALGSKTVTVTLPAALLVVFWWRHGKLSWRDHFVPLLPWFLGSAAIGLLTSWVERKVLGAEGADFTLPGVERVLLAGRAVWFYLGKLVWPDGLMFFYPRWDVSAAGVGWVLGLVALAVLTLGLWMLRHRTRGPLAGWLLFVGGLAPTLGFFNVFYFRFSYVSDHFQYLAGLGLLALAAAGATQGLAVAPRWLRRVGWLGIALIVGSLAVLSYRQSGLYRDTETLFRSAVAQNPATWMGHHILGFTLAKQAGGRAEAMEHFQEAVRLGPAYPDAHLALAVELARLPGRRQEAIAEYERALALRPEYVEAHNDLGLELARLPGRLPDAIVHYETALRLKPDFAEAHFNLANALANLPGRQAEALAHYQEALRLKPDFAAAHCAFAYHLSQLPGRESEAIRHYEEALLLRPNFVEAHNGLAIVYASLGQLDRAKAHWQMALQLDPNFETARQNLRLLEEMTAP